MTQPTRAVKAFTAVCTHQGCTVGMVEDGMIGCPCHGSTFDIATDGSVRHGPGHPRAAGQERSPSAADGITVDLSADRRAQHGVARRS